VFDINRMLSLKGDSAPYLQYSYVRAMGIVRKAGEKPEALVGSYNSTLLGRAEERQLVKSIAMFPLAIREAAKAFSPNVIAKALLTLAERFHLFYHNVPVLNVPDVEVQRARLVLVECTATVIHNGLRLLGIECPQKM
jgi:arginyl-tRNA synthetase